jgi:hypothetical protein
MKKLVMAVCVFGTVLCHGKEVSSLKSIHDNAVTNKTKLTEDQIKYKFGSQSIYDLCVAEKWDVDGIVDNLSGKNPSGQFVNELIGKVSKEKTDTFVRAVAETDVYMAVYILNKTKHGVVSADTEHMVFSSNVGKKSDSFLFKNYYGPEYCLSLYTVMKAIELGKPIRDNTVTEASFYVDWLLLGGKIKSVHDMTIAKEKIKKIAEKSAIENIRKQGKSFVTKNNKNPIEEAMTPVIDALNAPKLFGLEEALRGIGQKINDRKDLTTVWAEIEAEKNDIFYGRKAPRLWNSSGIIILLGPAGFNDWIDSYNGVK